MRRPLRAAVVSVPETVIDFAVFFCQDEGASDDVNFTCTMEQLQVDWGFNLPRVSL